jgi:Fe2+ transport system protein FeoA
VAGDARLTTKSSRGKLMINRMRTLTVSRLYREWGEVHRKNECVVPSIRLNGKWLAALGIVPGQQVRVVTNGATITIEPVSFDSELRRYGK